MAKTTAYLGLPIWKRLYGFGEELTIRARTVNAFIAGIDRSAVLRALPEHPLVRLHARTPLIVIHTEFLGLKDAADPDENDFPAHEVMLAVMLEPTVGRVPPLFPILLFVDEPVSIMAGREFHGFPKVLSSIAWQPDRVHVEYIYFPKRIRTSAFCMETRWKSSPRGNRALALGRRAIARALAPLGIDTKLESLEALALAHAGEVWNLRQVPDLANPRRAVLSQLTRFKPTLRDPSGFRWLTDLEIELAREGPWPLAQLFESRGPRVLGAFGWEVTMTVRGGDVIDSW